MPTNVALTGLAKDLAARAETGKPVRIGLVGAGEMGTDIVSRVAHMRGIEIGAISELNPQAAGRSVSIAYGDPDRAVATDTTDALNAAIESGASKLITKLQFFKSIPSSKTSVATLSSPQSKQYCIKVIWASSG
jgi:predicted homoserine dehydrogenase-like protein